MKFPVQRQLHKEENHPIKQLKDKIYSLFDGFEKYDDLPREVSIDHNFNKLLIPFDHPSRQKTDTYYIDEKSVLRTHTSAHQHELLKRGETQFLVTGDVYRRDTIDRYHYPVFHQMEGVKLCDNPKEDLKETIEKILNLLFPGCAYRQVDSYFPFTENSSEWEVYYDDKWIEVLGCGTIQPKILESCDVQGTGWAFGMGLERLAMILCKIPDIRLMWTEDERFTKQFENGLVEFVPYSKHPVCYKDVTFWANEFYNFNLFCEKVRELGGDIVESIEILDTYMKNSRMSYCLRINYRSHDRTLTNEEINKLQSKMRSMLVDQLGCELR